MSDQAYWATVAQVVPTLLIACLLEWRLASRSWARTPLALRWYFGICWTASLSAACYVEAVALSSMRKGTAHAWQPFFADGTVAVVMGLLFFLPALEILLRLLARPLLWSIEALDWRALDVDLRIAVARWNTARRVKRMDKWAASKLAELGQMETDLDAQSHTLRGVLSQMEASGLSESADAVEARRWLQALEDLSAEERSLKEEMESGLAQVRRFPEELADLDRRRQEQRQRKRDRRQKYAKRLASLPPFDPDLLMGADLEQAPAKSQRPRRHRAPSKRPRVRRKR